MRTKMLLSIRFACVTATLGAALAACSSQNETERGIEVQVELAAMPAATDAVSATLVSGLLSSTAIEIVPCTPPIATNASWLDLFERRAEAHVASSPTRLGVPLVFDLTSATPRVQGTLYPPPGRYCAIKWEVGPADQDAPGADAGADIIGSSVQALVAVSGSPIAAQTTARAGGTLLVPPWTVNGTRTTPYVLRLVYDVGALAAGMYDGEGQDAAGRQLLTNISSAISVSLF